MVEAGIVGVPQQLDGFGFRLAEMHGAEGAHILAQAELAAGLGRHILIGPAQALEVRRIGDQDPRHDAGLRGVADGDFAHREGLEQRRVRLLVGLRDHADLADDALVVDLARRAVGRASTRCTGQR